MTSANIEHHMLNLKVQIIQPVGPDASVWLEQDDGSQTTSMSLHASQVRFLAEELGFLALGGVGAAAVEHRARMFRMLDLIHEKASALRDSLDAAKDHEVDAQAAAGLADFAAFMREDFAPGTTCTTGEVSA